MTTASLKDTLKAVSAVFAQSPCPKFLPLEVQLAVESFLDQHQDPDDRVHEELLALYNKHVPGDAEKQALFLDLLRLLRPAIRGARQLAEWWDLVVRPSLTTVGRPRDQIDNAREFLLGILIFDSDDDTTGEAAHVSSLFSRKLLDEYLARTTISSKETGVSIREDEFVSQELESIITAYGRKKPRELLLALDELFSHRDHRLQTLGLLSAFIQSHPPHLHLVLQTPLWETLQRCLMTETSSTVVELALTVLIMFLPYTASNLIPHLPKLYLIYARILCWDTFQASASTPDAEDVAATTPEQSTNASITIEGPTVDDRSQRPSDRPQLAAPCVMHYFTFLYGLFPFNFLSFVRKPRKWLKKMDFPGADDFDFDQEVLHGRTKSFQQAHLLHPNFYTTTLEDELEENRWLKSDPADVVNDCMALCVTLPPILRHPAPPGPPPTSKLPEVPQTRPSSRDTTPAQESNPKTPETDSPTLPPQKAQDNVEAMKGALPGSLSPIITRINSSENPPPTFPPASPILQVPGTSPAVAYLQRELARLRNDLNFERYLKQQHLSHIGQLQRQHLKEATVEAETQNIINTNRMLKAKLTKANELYGQLKKEMATSRNQSKKWEAELSAKIRVFREEQKKWQFDEQTLRLELAKAREDCERLKELVLDSETKELNSKQRLEASRMDLEELETFKQEIEELRSTLKKYRMHEQEFEEALDERDHLRNELQSAYMKLESRDEDRERAMKAYERRIAELEARLQGLNQSAPPGSLPPAVQQMVDSALAASNAKLQHLKRTHSRLHDKYIELEMKCHELERERDALATSSPVARSRSPQLHPGLHDEESNYPFKRTSTPTSGTYGSYANARFGKPSLLAADTLSEDDEYYRSHYSPPSPAAVDNFPQNFSLPARPVRLESLNPPGSDYPNAEPKILSSARDLSSHRDLGLEYERELDPGFYQPRPVGENRSSNGKDTASLASSGSGGRDRKEKIAPKSQVRVYGRGGAQNIGKKDKAKDKDADKSHKTGTFRGLRGIM